MACIDRNRLNNNLSNLQILTGEQHYAKDRLGERNGRAVLCEADVVDIRTRYTHRGSGPRGEGGGSHPPQAELAAEYGVSDRAIRAVLSGGSWAHVEAA